MHSIKDALRASTLLARLEMAINLLYDVVNQRTCLLKRTKHVWICVLNCAC